MTLERPRIYLVDAHGYLHRAHHALAGSPLSNSRGEPVGALFGFARLLLGLVKKEKPDALAVCFDAPGPTFRHEAYAEYKATRLATDDALKPQLTKARRLASVFGFKTLELGGFEADDLLGTLAVRAVEAGWDAVLVTGDKDALQLVGPHVQALDGLKGVRVDEAAVAAKYGVKPAQLVDYFALIGDAVDNIIGAKGVGPKTASKLLAEHGTLERLLELAEREPSPLPKASAQSLRDFKPRAESTKALLRLATNVPVEATLEECRVKAPGADALDLLRELEFTSLVKELFPQGLAIAGPARIDAGAFLKGLAPGAKFTLALVEAPPVSESQPELTAASAEPVFAAGLQGGGVCVAAASELKAALGSSLPKIGHDLKPALKAAAVADPFFDAALAAYCLNPSKASYRFEDVLLDHLAQPFVTGAGPDAAARQAAGLWPLAGKLEGELKAQGLWTLYQEVELPLVRVLAAMERAGVAVDTAHLRALAVEFDARIEGLKAEIAKLAGGPVNPNSPKQLAKVLFEDLKLPVVRRTKTGISTDEETLKKLAPHHPLPAKLVEFREWTKLKGTYIDALLSLAVEGRVRTTFNQTGTATGRLSSVQPNLQNIPIRTPLGMKIRRAFVAPKGAVLLSADYSQIDLRLLAHESGDEALLSAFKNGTDVHVRTAGEVFHKEPKAVTPEERRIAKAVNFGVVYGQTPHGLAEQLGIGRDEAQGIIARYFERHSGVKKWIDSHLEAARRDGFVRTWLGRIRYLPELQAKNPNLRAFAERAAVNTTIQGGSADVMKKAMLAVAAGLGDRATMVLQVHDELVFEVPRSSLKETSAWIRDAMEQAAELRVPLVVDLKAGPTWADMEKLA